MSLNAAQPLEVTVHPLPEASNKKPMLYTPAGESDMSFDDFVDVINPLQHIPVVNHVYRAITGDEISSEARVMGGALFGGVIGLAAAGIDSIIKQESGASIGEHAVAMVTGEHPINAPVLEVAQATPSASVPAVTGGSLDDVLIQAQLAAPAAATLPKPKPPQANAYHDAATLAPPAPAVKKPDDEKDSVNEAIRYLFGSDGDALNAEYQTSQALDHILEVTKELVA